MRYEMPSGIPATSPAHDLCRREQNRRIFPMLRSMGPLFDTLCGKARPVLKLNHKRTEFPRLQDTVGLYLPCPVEAVERSSWWAENKFRTKGLLYLFPMAEGHATCDYGAGRTTLMYEEIFYGPVGRAVHWYLMLSYLYYQHDESFVPDAMFDKLCSVLLERVDEAKASHHGRFIHEDSLRAGTGFDIAGKLPEITMNAALGLLCRDKITLE